MELPSVTFFFEKMEFLWWSLHGVQKYVRGSSFSGLGLLFSELNTGRPLQYQYWDFRRFWHSNMLAGLIFDCCRHSRWSCSLTKFRKWVRNNPKAVSACTDATGASESVNRMFWSGLRKASRVKLAFSILPQQELRIQLAWILQLSRTLWVMLLHSISFSHVADLVMYTKSRRLVWLSYMGQCPSEHTSFTRSPQSTKQWKSHILR